uniref:transketolase-like TK C-terminal-containing protein n=1 Tax=uncultured Enterococcus sp. TaxID=167972 RepID=UPI0025893C79
AASDVYKRQPDGILIATGSEVNLAVQAQKDLKEQGKDVSVVSLPSFDLFEAQDEAYKESVLPKAVKKRVAIEAASPFGWERYIGSEGKMIGIDHFGASAPGDYVLEQFGFTVENVVNTFNKL